MPSRHSRPSRRRQRRPRGSYSYIHGGDDLGPLGVDNSGAASGAQAQARKQLSAVLKNYDVGNKGFLTESEQERRQYATNEDGRIDVNEMKKIVGDLRETAQQRNRFRKVAGFAAGCFVLATLANAGLAWATLALTRQLDVQGLSLVNKDGGRLNVRARGERVAMSMKHRPRNRHVLDGSKEVRAAFPGEIGRILKENNYSIMPGLDDGALDILKGHVKNYAIDYEVKVGDTSIYTGSLLTASMALQRIEESLE